MYGQLSFSLDKDTTQLIDTRSIFLNEMQNNSVNTKPARAIPLGPAAANSSLAGGSRKNIKKYKTRKIKRLYKTY